MDKICFLFASLLMIDSLTAAIYYEMDTTQPLKCSFSYQHLNRIMVESQGIDKIIHSEAEAIQILIEEKANQAFVIASGDLPDPVTLCIIASNGEVQDLEVTFENQSSQLVILRQKNQEPCLLTPVSKKCQIQSIIQSILSNQIPFNSIIVDFSTDPMFIKKKIKMVETKRFDQELELIRVFEISNCSKQKQIIYEQELAIENANWIFLEKNILQPRETVTVIVSMRKD